MAVTKKEMTFWETDLGQRFDNEAAALHQDKVDKIVKYLTREESNLYWREISAEEVIEALLEVYDITPIACSPQ